MEFTPLLSNNTRLIFGAEIQPKIIDKNVDKEIDIAKAIDEEGEVFICKNCGKTIRYTDK
jgi:hypothetical protein